MRLEGGVALVGEGSGQNLGRWVGAEDPPGSLPVQG